MTPSVSYRIRRSTFPAPTTEEILAAPLLADETGRLMFTQVFVAAKDGNLGGPCHAGTFGCKECGLVFLPGEDSLEAIENAPVPDVLKLVTAAASVLADAERTAADRLADPLFFVLPFVDVVEVSVVKSRGPRLLSLRDAYEALVTCEDGSGQRRRYRFREMRQSRLAEMTNDFARLIVAMRVARDLDAAVQQAMSREMDRYLDEARRQLQAKYGDLTDREHLVWASARQLYRQAVGPSVSSHQQLRRRGIEAVLGDLVTDYQRMPDVLGQLSTWHRQLLS